MSIKNRNSGLSGEPLLQANMQCTNMASCCAFLGRLGLKPSTHEPRACLARVFQARREARGLKVNMDHLQET